MKLLYTGNLILSILRSDYKNYICRLREKSKQFIFSSLMSFISLCCVHILKIAMPSLKKKQYLLSLSLEISGVYFFTSKVWRFFDLLYFLNNSF